MQEVTASEHCYYPGVINWAHLLTASLRELSAEQSLLYSLEDNPCRKNHTDPVREAGDVLKEVPWFLACNKERFPYWFGVTDPRIRLLQEYASQLVRDSQDVPSFDLTRFYV